MSYQIEVENEIATIPVKDLIVASILLKDKLPHIPVNAYYKSLERMVNKGKLKK